MFTFISKAQPAASSSAEAENSCAIARGIMPCCAGVPSIVCVLPEPVAPARANEDLFVQAKASQWQQHVFTSTAHCSSMSDKDMLEELDSPV